MREKCSSIFSINPICTIRPEVSLIPGENLRAMKKKTHEYMKKSQYPYPVETLKHWYVTIVGGQSTDLKPGYIGVNSEALAENTNITPYEDNVLISKLEDSRVQPLFTKNYFTVVPLDNRSPDASSQSPNGEVVFSIEDRKRKNWSLEPIEVGDSVILNNVLSQRFPRGFVYGLDRLIKRRSGQSSLEYRDN